MGKWTDSHGLREAGRRESLSYSEPHEQGELRTKPAAPSEHTIQASVPSRGQVKIIPQLPLLRNTVKVLKIVCVPGKFRKHFPMSKILLNKNELVNS